MPPRSPRARTRLFPLLCAMAGPLLSTACAGTPKPPAPGALRVTVDARLRAPCQRPSRPVSPTVGQLAGFSIRQEAALNVCEGFKDAAVAIVDAQNDAAARQAQALRPRRWFEIWRR